ncbi:glutathione-disulfide reductase [Psittacicella melopsittaci]|uniref:Glutathione-disulfide reductase n=1 Tax=Psittacicella melopsittaci TaxID=2028576 RepID=A0A3A1Y527_9GAMM|nr:glutathione-disulfide reductase [Psittacicella melopsittaci]RIY31267.1 glutathione-disulfide reductase [Psittacicella melopsittaci]
MQGKYDFDLLVLGGGSGGIATANRAAIYGAKVGVIEAKDLGGTCVNVGCVPKKVLWNGANLYQQIKTLSQDYGFATSVDNLDFAKLVEARQAYISRIHTSYNNSFNNNKVTLINGWGQFEDQHHIKVTDAQGEVKVYSAERILIATGGKAVYPNIPGAELGTDSDGFFALTELPKSAVIVGAGYIAVEIAGVLNSFGVKTTLVTRGDRPLRWVDKDITSELLENFAQQGLKHLGNSEYTKVEKLDNGQIRLVTNHGNLDSDFLVWAIGREPNTSGLNLEKVGVELDDQGYIVTNDLSETTQSNILAIGDIVRLPALTPVAIKTGRMLAERLYNNKPNYHFNKKSYIPTVIFSHPAIGTVGMCESKALETYGAYDPQSNPNGIRIYKSKFTSMLTAVTSHPEKILMKLIVQGPNEVVVGLHGIGFGVDEMIQGFAVAMGMGATKADFDNTVAIHPTGSEEFVTMR